MTRLAYIVTAAGASAGDDDYQTIEFMTESEAADVAEDGHKIERCECFDQYAAKGVVPAKAYYENGWWQECDQCYRRFGEDGYDDGDDDYCDDDESAAGDEAGDVEPERDLSPQFDGSFGFCSRRCHADWQQRRERVRKVRAEAMESLKSRAPWITEASFHTGCPGSCNCFSRDRENQYASIRFPGSKHGGTYCHGCRAIHISSIDLPAWNAAQDEHRKAFAIGCKEVTS